VRNVKTWPRKLRNCFSKKYFPNLVQIERAKMGGTKLGDIFPNAAVKTTEGDFNLHDFIGDSYCILFSHPADYTPVCTTELGNAAKYAPQFKELNCKLIGLSIDSVADHKGWIEDIKAYNSLEGNYITFCYYIMLLRNSSFSKISNGTWVLSRNYFFRWLPIPYHCWWSYTCRRIKYAWSWWIG